MVCININVMLTHYAAKNFEFTYYVTRCKLTKNLPVHSLLVENKFLVSCLLTLITTYSARN